MHQFGRIHKIPLSRSLLSEELLCKLHKQSRAGGSTNWSVKHRRFIRRWEDRHDRVNLEDNVIEDGRPTVEDGYFHWFLQRTVKFVVNPSRSRNQIAPEGYMGHTEQLRLMIDILIDISLECHERADQYIDNLDNGPFYRRLVDRLPQVIRIVKLRPPALQSTQCIVNGDSSMRRVPQKAQQRGRRGGARPGGGRKRRRVHVEVDDQQPPPHDDDQQPPPHDDEQNPPQSDDEQPPSQSNG